MENRREFADPAPQDIRLPREVYYRCLWTVRDMPRLESLVSLLSENAGNSHFAPDPDNLSGLTARNETAVVVSDDAARQAEWDLSCIKRAIMKVPPVYREGLLDNIVSKEPPGDFAHQNTWKRWKLVFLHELAKELNLI